MVRYRVRHVTRYAYRDPVPLSHNVTYLRPRESPTQRTLAYGLSVTPAPAWFEEQTDFFGNMRQSLSIEGAHTELTFEMDCEVEVRPQIPPSMEGGIRPEAAREMLRTSRDPAVIDARQYTFESPFVPIDPALAEYASLSFAPGRCLMEAALDLTHRINTEFIFDPEATDVGSPVLDVLRDRRGVCQDFAHLQIGCLRSMGLAARYVSGYLLTLPPPGQPKMVGADASHAWASVFIPGSGWVDLDPTNDCIPNTQHVTLGWARDYDDLAPVRGVIVGGGEHTLEVAVDVDEVDAAGDATSRESDMR